MSFQTLKTMKSKAIAPAFASGSHTNISFAYDANNQVVNATVSGGNSSGTLPDVVSTTSNAYVPTTPASGTLEVTYLLSPTANATVTLTNIVPSLTNKGMKINFKKMTSFLVTINPSSGVTIDGLSAGTDIIQQYACLTIQSTGTDWIII